MNKTLLIAVVTAIVLIVAYFAYKKYYPTEEGFSSGLDPSVRLSVQGIGPIYDEPDVCPNCQ